MSNLLLESSGSLLLESGGHLVLESTVATSGHLQLETLGGNLLLETLGGTLLLESTPSGGGGPSAGTLLLLL